jgi:CRISPR/Cas system-associated exonuclease Cas4 (RecB family)
MDLNRLKIKIFCIFCSFVYSKFVYGNSCKKMISPPFLKEIAGIILNRHDYDLNSVCVVFPNKRARLYLSRYIGDLTSKPVWAPRYFTISELMEVISGYRVADRMILLFELYHAYVTITGSQDSFDTFYPYGETLLTDFDEIDKYLVNADDIFRNLADLKNLEGRFNYLTEEQIDYIRKFWSAFSIENPAAGKSNFISLWESLSGVYHEFIRRLQGKQLAYEGMAYRKAVEDPDNITKAFSDDPKFVFVGFNALSIAEDKLFMTLKNSGKADFFWDYDETYLDEVHEAGTFIRRNLARFPEKHTLSHNHFTDHTGQNIQKNNILFVPVYSDTGQALIIPDVLKRLGIEDAKLAEKTAIVLADEKLLINTLYSIPAVYSDINVTMGYPLSNSAIFSLIDSLYELNRNARNTAKDERVWYFGDVMAVMNNPLLKNWYNKLADKVRNYALEKHLVYLPTDAILQGSESDIIFNENLKTDTINYLVQIVTQLIREIPVDKKKATADPVQVEMLFGVYTFLIRLHDILNEQNIKTNSDTVFRLIRKILRSLRIPFSGEPLAGLQILGILETRTLDFDNVIILSANEGVLPGPSDKPSFIPYNLRAGFGLPLPGHHDAIYAFYFYRLIQRARNVALIYNASSGGLQTGERSRFLHQLYYDMKLNITEIQVGSSISQIPVKPVIIKKTEEVSIALKDYLKENGRTLSPSAINEFLNCPVKFYFHYLAGLKQPEEVGEDVDARLFGNLIHNSLRRIYKIFGNEMVTPEKIRKIRDDQNLLDDIVDQAFCEEIFDDKDGTGGRKPEGYNLIVHQVILTYLGQFLKAEISATPFRLISLEEKYYTKISLNVEGEYVQVSTGGIIDRIDEKNGFKRILDYKTGVVKNKFSSVASLFGEDEKERNDAVFQVLLYSYVYQRLNPGVSIAPGLFFLRQSHLDNFSEAIIMGQKNKLDDFSVVADEFEVRLQKALERLFDKKIPFVQTDNLKICGYCAYAGICRRPKANLM